MDNKTLPMISHALREYIHPNALEPLNGFVLVKAVDGEKVKSMYFCFGRHDFFLVPRNAIANSSSALPGAQPPITSRKIQVYSYRAVDKILKCIDAPEKCTLVFTRGTIRRYKNETSSTTASKPVYVDSMELLCSERERLLIELLVGIKASHMFLTFEVHTREIVEEYYEPKQPTIVQLKSKRQSVAAASAAAGTAGSLQLAFQGYVFLRPSDYEEVPRPGLLKKQFDKPVRGGGEVQFELGKASSNPYAKLDAASLHFEMLGSAEGSLQSVAERAARAICSQVEDWRLVQRPGALPKTCANDPSLWSCWMMKFRTLKSTSRALEYRLVTLIACRREFCPPSMTASYDFVITHFSQYNDLDASSSHDVAMRVLQSLQPEAKTFDRDEFAIQCTLDALLLDSVTWSWLDTTVHLRPQVHDTVMRKFCHTLFGFLLEQPNQNSIWSPAQKIQNISLVNAWDAQAAAAVQQQQGTTTVPGAGLRSSLSSRRFSTNFQTASSSTYEGGGGEAEEEEKSNSQGEDEAMLATLMYLVSLAENHPPALDVTALTMDEDTKRDWAAWKLRVWAYLAHCLDGAMYHQVLDFDLLTRVWKAANTKPAMKRTVGVLLDRCINLQNNTDNTLTLRDLCLQSINAPSLTFNSCALAKLLKTGYVQAVISEHDATLFSKFLVRLLFCDEEHSNMTTAEPISHAVLKSLVTFSLDEDREANLNLLVPALIRAFMSHAGNDKLRTWCVGILVNFSHNNHAVKSNILAGGGFTREIIMLLHSKDDDLVRHACSLLLNLAKTSSEFRQSLYRGNLKQYLVDLLRKTVLANVQVSDLFRAPKIIALAAQCLGHLAVEEDIRLELLEGDETQNDSDGLYRISALVRMLADLVCKEQHLGDEVRFSCLFALKNLSIGTNVRASLGRYASKDFIRILRDKEVKDAMVVDYMLRVVYSLCWDLKISSKLMSENLTGALALRKLDFPNLCNQIKAKVAANQDESLKQAARKMTLSEDGESNGGGGSFSGAAAPTTTPSTPTSQAQQPAGSISGGILRVSRASRNAAAALVGSPT